MTKQPHILITCCTIAACLGTYDASAAVTESEAARRAEAFLGRAVQTGRHPAAKRISCTPKVVAADTPDSLSDAFYLFGIEGAPGFVIVNADEDTPAPILGYSLDTPLDLAMLPEGARQMLQRYAASSRQVSAPTLSNLYGEYHAVAPLLGSTRWRQDAPYNNECPVEEGYNAFGQWISQPTMVGCVPLAMGQIVRYHHHPATYDWSLIADEHGEGMTTATQDAEVSRLLHDLGVSVGAQYRPSSTSATTTGVKPALVDDYGYSPSMVMRISEYYTLAAWDAMIYGELQQDRPVYYAGVTKDYHGHAFVCDGMDADGFLHINWGWGGMADGYFAPYLLSPREQGIGGATGGYNFGQEVVLGIRPAAPDDKPSGHEFMFTSLSTADGTAFDMALRAIDPQGEYGWNGYTPAPYVLTLPASGHQFGMRAVDVATGSVAAESSAAVTGDASLRVDAWTLPDGEYRIFPTWRDADTQAWQWLWPAREVAVPYVTVRVADGSVSVIAANVPEAPALTVTRLDIPAVVDPWGDGVITVEVRNDGAPFYGDIQAVIANPADNKQVMTFSVTGDMRPGIDTGSSVSLDIPASRFRESEPRLDSGDYRLTLTDGDGVQLGETATVRLVSRGFAATEIDCPVLRGLLTDTYDSDRDGWFSDYEMGRVEDVKWENAGITSLRGLDRFPMLCSIEASDNLLTEVDLKGLPQLQTVSLSTMPTLKKIQVNDCPRLSYVGANYNNALSELSIRGVGAGCRVCAMHNALESLDLSDVDLSSLECNDNRLETLALPDRLPLIESIEVQNNLLSELTLPDGMPRLTFLNCAGNRLSSLNLSSLPALETLNVRGNQLTHGDFRHLAALKTLDVSQNRLLFAEAPVGTDYQCNSETAVAFDGDGFDLASYVAQGMDLSKLRGLTGARLVGNRLVLDDPSRPMLSYYYSADGAANAGQLVTLLSADAIPTVSTRELVLPAVGDEAWLEISDPARLGYSLSWNEEDDGVIEIAESEYIEVWNEAEGWYDIVGDRNLIRRIGPGDITLTFTAIGGGTTLIRVCEQSAIGDIISDSETSRVPVAYYDLSGRPLASPSAAGITIVRYSDGTVAKLLMR
ncbi:MAG: C10 family peptidase [Muribaculaceae bacterium]